MRLHRPNFTRSKLSFKAMAKALTAIVHLDNQGFNPLPSDPCALQRELDTAMPAEKTWCYADFLEFSAEDIAYLCLAQQSSDGLWICCCGHENPLTHFQGQSPFKHLTCGNCDHILCAGCSTTDILTMISSKCVEPMTTARSGKASGEAVRHCSVCTRCGLSHRATMDGRHLIYHEDSCPCGEVWTKALHYFIGAVDGWRKDPGGQAVALCHDRTMAGTPPMKVGSRCPRTAKERRHQQLLFNWPTDGRVLRARNPDVPETVLTSDQLSSRDDVRKNKDRARRRLASVKPAPPLVKTSVSPLQTQPRLDIFTDTAVPSQSGPTYQVAQSVRFKGILYWDEDEEAWVPTRSSRAGVK
jgi:hypothetical protein